MGIEQEQKKSSKDIYEKPTNIILTGESISRYQEEHKDVHSYHFYSTLDWRFQTRQLSLEKKRLQIEKEEVKLSLFADDMILYMENPKQFTKKLLTLANDFKKVAEYKINIDIN